MCGIAGVYHFRRRQQEQGFMNWCLSTMKHRGPDGAGKWDNGRNYETAFTRLAIRDLSAHGDQPMLSACGNFCISFNGEIYNTGTLRNLLKPFRSSFNSSSDTEVLLYALVHLGIEKTLACADGMFAFAFYDNTTNVLVLARDRAGIKPLYVGVSGDGVVFSSQFDHIINHYWFRKEAINASAIANYLLLGYVPEGEGAVYKTQLLPHGHYLVVAEDSVRQDEYYSYLPGTIPKNENSLDTLLYAAVADELVSDVPLGSFMSGGVDSTLVTYFANKVTPMQSFTIGIKDDVNDESEAAQAFASIFNTSQRTRFVASSDLSELLEQNVNAYTEPFSDFSSLPTLFLSKYAREFVTVALSGDGGDELFFGYPRSQKAFAHLPYYRKGKGARRWQLAFDKVSGKHTDISRHWHESNFLSYYYSMLGVTGASQLVPLVCKAAPSVPFFLAKSEALFERCASQEALMNVTRKLEFDMHLQRILLKVDRASMYHSLEVRVPLLGNRMLDYSCGTDYHSCSDETGGKKNLKQLLINKSKASLVMRPKKGFIIPIDNWIRREVRKEVTDAVLNMPDTIACLLDMQYIEQILSAHMKGTKERGWFIWSLYCLSTWYYRHFNQYSP